MNVTDLFIRRPVLASAIGMLIFLLGVASFSDLPIRQFPKLQSPVITVSKLYPGASPDLMKSFITTPIAQSVATADGIDYLTSTSFTSQSIVTAHLKLDCDPEKTLTDILAKVQQVKYFLPRDANDPIIVKDMGQVTPALFIGFASDTMSSAAISDYLTRAVQPFVAKVNGVASTEILGSQTFAMRLWIDPRKIAARGISADDLAAAIRANHYRSAPGQIKGHYTVADVSAETDLNDVEQFRDIVVKAVDGGLVRIKDIAEVELGAQNTNSTVTMNGRRAVFLAVKATPDSNPLAMVDAIRQAFPELKRGLPVGLDAEITYDSTKFIRASIDEAMRAVAYSMAIVLAVICFFLASFRAVLIPVVTIPLSLVGVMTAMLARGFSLNLLTLLAMVLAIGLVVDDAIVVVENVHRWIGRGETPLRAAIIGTREIAGPVVAMTLTLAAVYAPKPPATPRRTCWRLTTPIQQCCCASAALLGISLDSNKRAVIRSPPPARCRSPVAIGAPSRPPVPLSPSGVFLSSISLSLELYAAPLWLRRWFWGGPAPRNPPPPRCFGLISLSSIVLAPAGP